MERPEKDGESHTVSWQSPPCESPSDGDACPCPPVPIALAILAMASAARREPTVRKLKGHECGGKGTRWHRSGPDRWRRGRLQARAARGRGSAAGALVAGGESAGQARRARSDRPSYCPPASCKSHMETPYHRSRKGCVTTTACTRRARKGGRPIVIIHCSSGLVLVCFWRSVLVVPKSSSDHHHHHHHSECSSSVSYMLKLGFRDIIIILESASSRASSAAI